MVSFKAISEAIFRILTFRRLRNIPSDIISFRSAIGLMVALSLVAILVEWIMAAPEPQFDLYGINSAIAGFAVAVVVILAFARGDRTGATFGWLVLIYVVTTAIVLALLVAVDIASAFKTAPLVLMIAAVGLLVSPIWLAIWQAGAARRVFERLSGARRPALRGFAFGFALQFAIALLPGQALFSSDKSDRTFSNYWELAFAFARATKGDSAEDVARRAEARQAEEEAIRLKSLQPRRLVAALDALAPRTPNESNIFLVGVAGWGVQRVFMRELDKSMAILASRFEVDGHVVSLIDDPQARESNPLASVQNLAQVLREVGARMDRDRDVLVLFLTSHGSTEGVALYDPNLVSETLDPATLKGMLEDAGVKNRIVIVSSCYAGVFVPTLSDPNTMVIAAAAADRTSFGCADDREWTFFGEALFARGFSQRATFVEAFETARAVVADWERNGNITASNPQIFVGDEIAARFPAIVGAPRAELAGSQQAIAAPPRPGADVAHAN